MIYLRLFGFPSLGHINSPAMTDRSSRVHVRNPDFVIPGPRVINTIYILFSTLPSSPLVAHFSHDTINDADESINPQPHKLLE